MPLVNDFVVKATVVGVFNMFVVVDVVVVFVGDTWDRCFCLITNEMFFSLHLLQILNGCFSGNNKSFVVQVKNVYLIYKTNSLFIKSIWKGLLVLLLQMIEIKSGFGYWERKCKYKYSDINLNLSVCVGAAKGSECETNVVKGNTIHFRFSFIIFFSIKEQNQIKWNEFKPKM